MTGLSNDDLEAIASTDVRNPIPQDTLLSVLSSPPFIPTRSLINLRDLGAVSGSAITKGLAYRCGTLDSAAKDPQALTWLGTHVRRIFDLRKESERAAAPDPVIPGVENVWLQQETDYPTPDLVDFALDEGKTAWRQQYLNAALSYRPTIRAILEHVRDRPYEPFLFHCTAGRDRTGVMAGILQMLAHTPPDVVKRDYLLSRIGIEPARDKLLHFAKASVGIEDVETPGFYNLISLKPEYWEAFEEGLQDKFGGVEGYVTEGLGLSKEDLETIKKNLR